MTFLVKIRRVSCRDIRLRSESMEVSDSPLNLAHQQCRKAERLVAAGKYEDAVSCHGKAADLLTEAMKSTEYEQARLSMELQRDQHIKQQSLIRERWKREARREAARGARPGLLRAPPGAQHRPPAGPPEDGRGHAGEREYDTLLYQLQVRQAGAAPAPAPACPGSKTTKDDKTRLEEQRTTIKDLRRLVDHLMDENQRLAAENRRLCLENERLRSDSVERSELWVLPPPTAAMATGGGKEIAIPQLPPLEMPPQEDLCLDDLPPLDLPEDVQNELREILDTERA